MVSRGRLAERGGRRIGVANGNSGWFRLGETEGDAGLRVLAAFKRRRPASGPRAFRQNFLVPGQRLGRLGGAVHSLIKPAELIMPGGMVGLKLNQRFEFADGILEVPQSFLGDAQLEIQGVHRGLDLLRLLKCLDRRPGLIQPQMGATHQVIGRRVVVVEGKRGLALFDDGPVVVRQQVGVGQVQMRIDAFRGELDGLRVGGNGVRGIAFFEIALTERHRAFEAAGIGLPLRKKHQYRHHGEADHDPKQEFFHRARVCLCVV